jgi:hypothetical protein
MKAEGFNKTSIENLTPENWNIFSWEMFFYSVDCSFHVSLEDQMNLPQAFLIQRYSRSKLLRSFTLDLHDKANLKYSKTRSHYFLFKRFLIIR